MQKEISKIGSLLAANTIVTIENWATGDHLNGAFIKDAAPATLKDLRRSLWGHLNSTEGARYLSSIGSEARHYEDLEDFVLDDLAVVQKDGSFYFDVTMPGCRPSSIVLRPAA